MTVLTTTFKKLIARPTTELGLLLLTLTAFFACGKRDTRFSPEKRRITDSIISSIGTEDSLAQIQKTMEQRGDRLGSIVALRELGRWMRNQSRFDKALKYHFNGLKQAENVHDTLEIVKALNNIGTDYRRLGVLDVAADYHYRALTMSQEYNDTSSQAQRNRVISLNGLGNIYLTMGNLERADSVLHMALAGEKKLHSDLGQAINYANLGSIFRKRGKTDSAWVYYRRAMVFNQKAHSELGMALCHTYLGSLYEDEQEYENAIVEYNIAYESMKQQKDEWHELVTMLAMARIQEKMGNTEMALSILEEALSKARDIKSVEYQAEIFELYYFIYKRKGDFRLALFYHEKAAVLQDSVMDIKKINQIQNISLGIERNRQMKKVNEAKQKYEAERASKRVFFLVFALIIVIFVVGLAQMYYMMRIKTRNQRAMQRLSSMRETFFTNITHEFRTPLTVILGLCRNLQRTAPDDQTRGIGKTIEHHGNNLLTLINQLLEISKVKSVVGEPDWRHGNLTAHIATIVDGYRQFAHEKLIELNFIAQGPMEMDFVPDYINKVVGNLLSNALKFTPEHGRIEVTAKVEKGQAVISVSDTGPGMDEESTRRLFEPFFQVNNDSKHLGTGVGLALVRQLVDSINGNISVESVPGKGSRFIVTMPMKHGDGKWKTTGDVCPQKVAEPYKSSELKDSDNTDEGRTRILIVEDNRDVAAYTGSLLSDRYDLFYAANGKLGVKKAESIVPDLIITDLMMPEMDGLELCRHVRKTELISHVPIIVITAKTSEADRIKGLEAGADAYLDKPFNSDELCVRVEKLLEQRQLLREKFQKTLIEGKEEDVQCSDADQRFLSKVVDSVFTLMDRKQVDVHNVASQLCMSHQQLYRKIVSLTGVTPATYIMQLRMKRARLLLENHPEMNIFEVATSCGFDEPSNFTRNFRKIYGVPPTQYVKRGAPDCSAEENNGKE